jgi:3-mercaptopyruvate sulfurtransferase SseA
LQKNKADKKIIVYDDDGEKIAPRTATIFFEKGVDNIYMLSGG